MDSDGKQVGFDIIAVRMLEKLEAMVSKKPTVPRSVYGRRETLLHVVSEFIIGVGTGSEEVKERAE